LLLPLPTALGMLPSAFVALLPSAMVLPSGILAASCVVFGLSDFIEAVDDDDNDDDALLLDALLWRERSLCREMQGTKT
jgi:hypothetical protein